MNETEMLEKLNQFTKNTLTADDVYMFSVHLCDNDIDRGLECFSDKALEQLKELFIGKTGIFDHNAKSTNQVARIFDTEVVSEPSRTTVDGRPYKYLKGYAYMVKTSSNEDFIKEIEGGIKKEVSVSCAVKSHICSICQKDKFLGQCNHTLGKFYNSKMCYTILDGATDAYEWSFVAVPAQVNAGVIKRFKQPENVSAVVEPDTNIDINKTLQVLKLKIEILKKRGMGYEY